MVWTPHKPLCITERSLELNLSSFSLVYKFNSHSPGKWYGLANMALSDPCTKEMHLELSITGSPTGLVTNYSLMRKLGQANIWYLFNVMYGIKGNSWDSRQNKEIAIVHPMTNLFPETDSCIPQLCGSSWTYMDFSWLVYHCNRHYALVLDVKRKQKGNSAYVTTEFSIK